MFFFAVHFAVHLGQCLFKIIINKYVFIVHSFRRNDLLFVKICQLFPLTTLNIKHSVKSLHKHGIIMLKFMFYSGKLCQHLVNIHTVIGTMYASKRVRIRCLCIEGKIHSVYSVTNSWSDTYSRHTLYLTLN